MLRSIFSKERLFYLYVGILILEGLYYLYPVFYEGIQLSAYKNFSLSDWFINYQEGFVRRGILGEILWYLWNTMHMHVGNVIYFISYSSTILLIGLFVKKWRGFNLSLYLLPSVFILGAFLMYPVVAYRRDALIFLLIYFSFTSYHCFLQEKRKWLCLFELISIFTILSHEASFFYFIPILVLHYFLYNRKIGLSFSASSIKAVLLFFPMGIVFLCTLIYKGDSVIASNIWHSWDSFFLQTYHDLPPMGEGVEALAWNSVETFKMHFNANFLTPIFGIPGFLCWIIIYSCIFYALMHINRIKIGVEKRSSVPFSVLLFLQICVYQFIFLLPMFTILSCDMRRVVIYWTVSSFLFYFSMGKESLKCLGYKPCIKVFHNWVRISSKGWLGTKWCYFIITTCICVPFAGFNVTDAFLSTVWGNIAITIRYIMFVFNQYVL